MSEVTFSDEQRRTLTALLDEIVPPSEDGRLPGAGAIGLASRIDEALQDVPPMRAMIEAGLAALDEAARRAGAADFASLAGAERLEAVDARSEPHPGVLPTLIFHTYTGYYLDPQVVEGLGLEARPPHPKGYEMEPNDLGLLDRVRDRGPFYREP